MYGVSCFVSCQDNELLGRRGRSIMNCYLCFVQVGCDDRPAFALCQRCNAAVCHIHLVEVTIASVIGMGGDSSPRYSMICRRCYETLVPVKKTPSPSSQRRTREAQGAPSGWSWWDWLWHRRQPVLPEPEEVVDAAEFFLKQQRHQ